MQHTSDFDNNLRDWETRVIRLKRNLRRDYHLGIQGHGLGSAEFIGRFVAEEI